MAGYGDGVFGGGDVMTRSMWVTVMENLCNGIQSLDSAPKTQFNDVHPGDWYYDGVMWAVETGIISGYEDGNFGPNDGLSREMLAAMTLQCANVLGL